MPSSRKSRTHIGWCVAAHCVRGRVFLERFLFFGEFRCGLVECSAHEVADGDVGGVGLAFLLLGTDHRNVEEFAHYLRNSRLLCESCGALECGGRQHKNLKTEQVRSPGSIRFRSPRTLAPSPRRLITRIAWLAASVQRQCRFAIFVLRLVSRSRFHSLRYLVRDLESVLGKPLIPRVFELYIVLR